METIESFYNKMDAFQLKLNELCNEHPLPTEDQKKRMKILQIKQSKKQRISKKETEAAFKDWHYPGADEKCEHCIEIIKTKDELEAFEKEIFGHSRLEKKSMKKDIDYIRGVVKMMKKGEEI